MSEKLSYFARDLIEKGEDFVIASVVDTKGSTPRKKGAVLLMKKDGSTIGTVGGGLLEAETEKLCRKTLETREKSRVYSFVLDEKQKGALDMGCGGDADVEIRYIDASDPGDFVDEFRLADTAYIFGGGHVAYALEPVLRHVDFKTVVIDDREEYANKERFPKAERTIAEPDFDHAFDHIETDEDSYIIIVTRGHRGDLQVLREALKRPFAYLGMIGSRRKNRLLYDELLKEGVSQELIDRVHAPIGLDIGSETPEEIAISIVAEIIKERAGKKQTGDTK
ncbi:MAG TPA: XdhC family protein [Candidatus Copromorpha excrementigallinarum]|uniref:XdhC family protein n=1 Tax=Candidatus Allocopromorpha excrementigallinarum TaxID=2840742 RepID=A0A9D1I011_9FIRM|nr:XdhC family protein [Candidatus Copromorpha excrementigallinarum]